MLAKKAVDGPALLSAKKFELTKPTQGRRERRSPWVVGLTWLAVALYAAAFFVPWWHITLYAPQYPKGLRLSIGLTGFGGEVQEVDILNHYIGMAKLAEAAPLERQLAPYGVALVILTVLAFSHLASRRWWPLVLAPAMLFPVGFLVDSFYWMHHFGNNLDPRAPIKLAPFTPQLFGSGVIGQFRTLALPHVGFVLVMLALIALIVATVLRHREARA